MTKRPRDARRQLRYEGGYSGHPGRLRRQVEWIKGLELLSGVTVLSRGCDCVCIRVTNKACGPEVLVPLLSVGGSGVMDGTDIYYREMRAY